MRMTLLLAAAMLAQPALAAGNAAPQVLAPSKPWNVNYADNYCRLGRTFGEGAQKITLMIDRFAPGNHFWLNLVGASLDRDPGRDEAEIGFGPRLPAQELPFVVGSFGTDTPAWLFTDAVSLRPDADGDGASATEIRIGDPLRDPLVLQTGSMKAAFAALDACTDQLLTQWGVDAASQHTATSMPQPIGTTEDWLRGDDPQAMQDVGVARSVQYLLLVGDDGKVTGCHIQQSANPASFNDALCDVLTRRARFKPARDKEGRPMPSYYADLARFMVR